MPNGAMEWTSPDSEAFAALSGDFNPLHTDEIVARRSLFGGCVAHGVAVALWALEATPALHGACPVSVTMNFDSPVHAGDFLTVESSLTPDGTQLVVSCGDQTVVRVGLARDTISVDASIPPVAPQGNPDCVALAPEDACDREGREALWLDSEAASDRYPRLLAAWGHAPVAAMLALTRIVGMRCPGVRALFLQAKITFHDASSATLPWRVRKVHPVTGRVMIDVGPGIVAGTLVAAFRPEPVAQPAYTELLGTVDCGAFDDWNALVVGGSRGLGELAAKLVCAGGGKVTVTGRRLEDARRVAGEISRAGGCAEALPLDVTDAGGFHPDKTDYSHLLYFATPPIRVNTSSAFQEADVARYTVLYVDAFSELVRVLSGDLRGVFYPSSVYVGNPPAGLEAYAAAKAAGERACARLSGEYPQVRFDVPRLPRLATDQTASVLPGVFDDSVSALTRALCAAKE